MKAADFEHWFPFGIEWTASGPCVNWFRMDEIGFDGSYFSQTVERCARRPFNLAFFRQTPIDMLGEIAETAPPLRLSGLIFHLSRCGSTLLSRQFAACPGTLVISEAPPIDAIVRAAARDSSISDETRVRWLQWLVRVLGRPLGQDSHRNYIVKLDAWHAFDLELFERAFPGVPWVFVYRDPVEVLASHMQTASYMMSYANAPSLLGIPVTEAVTIAREVYCARVLGRICAAVAAHRSEQKYLVGYEELPAAAWERVAPHLGIVLTPGEIRAMARTAEFNAKQPGVPFNDDRAAKQQSASGAVRAAVETWVTSAFNGMVCNA